MRESDLNNSKSVPAHRIMKFANKTGETLEGINLQNLLDSGKHQGFVNRFGDVYIGKKGELSVGDQYIFVSTENPKRSGWSKGELAGKPEEIKSTVDSYAELIAAKRSAKHFKLVINPKVLTANAGAPPEKDAGPTEPEDGFFLLGYWSNPYREDREYYWAGPFQDRKKALARGKTLQKHGQPKTFKDWMTGGNKVIRGVEKFKKEAQKVSLNPNVSDLHWSDSY